MDKQNGIIEQYDNLKAKHPDAMLLFRNGDFYDFYRDDAVKASKLLGLTVSNMTLPGTRKKIKMANFPYYDLDTYLPKLIKAGSRVAICDRIDNPEIKNKVKKGTKKADVKSVTDKKQKEEQKDGQKTEAPKAKEERKPREPQMITVNGEKVSHGHAFQSNVNPEDWFFTARIDGKQLKPQRMNASDLAAYQKKELTVPQLMERYYPTKIMPKVPQEAFSNPKPVETPQGILTVEKFNVYKEKNEQSPDFGKYRFYAQLGDKKMSTVATPQDLNAYFDRVVTPNQLIEKNFGERLHLKSAYENFKLPDGIEPKGIRIAKEKDAWKWNVSADLGDKGRTSKHEISFDDSYSLLCTRTATREQIAAKYLKAEINSILGKQSAKVEKSASLKR